MTWIRVKQTWELTATPEDAEALQDIPATCANPPSLTIKAPGPAPGSVGPTPSPPADDTYSSCDEDAEAGEPRVLGSKGSGREFLQSEVPCGRDGDGDRIACEKWWRGSGSVRAVRSERQQRTVDSVVHSMTRRAIATKL